MIQRFSLPNGLRVLHLEDHERPLVRVRLHLGIQPGAVPQGRQGLPQLLDQMLEQAETADLKADQLTQILEDSGIQLTHDLDPDGMSWQMVARSRDQDRAMGLLADRILRSVFLPSVLVAQRLACWRQEEGLEDPPRVRLRHALLRDPSLGPTRAGLEAISLEDLFVFRAQVLRPDRAVLVLHGDLGLEQAKRLVLLSLGAWTAPPPSPAAVVVPPAVPPEGPLLIPAPGQGLRLQAVAARPGNLSPEVIALLGLLVPGDPSLGPLCVSLEDGALVATLDANSSTKEANPMLLLLGKLQALRSRGFTQLDLDRARRAWLGRRTLETLHPETQMDSALAEALGAGVGEEPLKAVTLAELNLGLRVWLDPATFRLGAAGSTDLLKLGTP
jgi:hypothetical protein